MGASTDTEVSTGGMKRRWLRWIGALVLVSNQPLLVAFGLDALADAGNAVQYALGTLAGLLLILSSVELPREVPWYRLGGAGYVCLAAAFLASNVSTMDEPWWVAASVVGALTLGFIGFDVARGGRHFDVDTDVRAR